jgi:uncharacterized protein
MPFNYRQEIWWGLAVAGICLILVIPHIIWPAGLEIFLVTTAIVLIVGASQLFWIRRIEEWAVKLLPSARWREGLGAVATVLFFSLYAYNLLRIGRGSEPTHLTLKAALLEAPFRCWVVCSLFGFLVAVSFGLADRVVRGLRWSYRKLTGSSTPSLASPDRRRFLEQTAFAVSASPFVAGAYGLLYGRTHLETTNQRITLRRLPKAFHGFRITQLSDIHIGPFMTAEEIRKYVVIANATRPDLIVLTGDFVTWDASTQRAVVKVLAGLKAPFGVLGCLGNHELWTRTEDSITKLFAEENIRILREESKLIEAEGEALNLMGVDYQTRTRMGPSAAGIVRKYLAGVEHMVRPDTANILLSHNPNTFDRAAELGIDLSLAGHTHGGQVTLEFIHPDLSPSRLITRYVRGWFQQGESQLYVNRGIGTIGVPMRLGAPPEITVFELTRG